MAAQHATAPAMMPAAGPLGVRPARLAARTPVPAALHKFASCARLSTRRGMHIVAMAKKKGTKIPEKYTKISPNGELIFVKCTEPEAETAGGVLLPSSAQEKSTSGEVIGAGGACTQLKEGDTVLYNKFGLGATDLEFQGTDYVLMKEADCIGTIPTDGDVDELTPVGERVLVKVLKTKGKSTGGVLLPESAKDKPMSGIVVSVGAKAEKLAKDDKVIYFQFAGDRMKSRAGESFVVLRESDIFGKLEN